jgi:hypothetical protein
MTGCLHRHLEDIAATRSGVVLRGERPVTRMSIRIEEEACG